MRVKVVSWNIWLGTYLPEVLDFLREQNADIVGIQEVDADPATNQAGKLANELGYQYVFYPAYEGDVDTGKGDAVLARFPIVNSARHFLSASVEFDGSPTTEPRIAVEANLSVDGRTLTVFSTHLAYSAFFAASSEQAIQARTLAELTRDKERIILMGDFNALPESDTVKGLSSVLRHADGDLSRPTFTMYPHEYRGHKTAELSDRVDYVLISQDIDVIEAGVGISRGSNHLPIWAILDL